MTETRFALKRRIQPFERALAKLEIEVATGRTPGDGGDGALTLPIAVDMDRLVDRLTYCREISVEDNGHTIRRVTRQARREGAAIVARKTDCAAELVRLLPFRGDPPEPSHRELRYGPHGIHEYRGKYFPQLVKSVLNLSGVPDGSLVLDPWVGSGTTLVEAALNGFRSFGIDLNPLSVLISNAKVRSLTVEPRPWLNVMVQLEQDFNALSEGETGSACLSVVYDDSRIRERWGDSTDYLLRWFRPSALAKIDHTLSWIERRRHVAVRGVLAVSLSNVLRGVSLQDPEDLRIRRRRDDTADPLVFAAFRHMALRNIRSIVSFGLENGNGVAADESTAQMGDSRHLATICRSAAKAPDVVITSPPYCTALPYIDTDRLSLVILRMLPPSNLVSLDSQMIGSRELRNSQRQLLEARYAEEKHRLPASVGRCIDEIIDGNSQGQVGFRRLNTPALVAKYFFDMRDSLVQLASVLPTGGPCFIVIGSNHTKAGDRPVSIETDRFLADLACQHGFRLVRMIPMDMLVARDIHRKNAVKSETIMWLRRA